MTDKVRSQPSDLGTEVLPPVHNCCCEHVVDRFQAMPGPPEVVLAAARRQLQDCPHTQAGNLLEMLVFELRDAASVPGQ